MLYLIDACSLITVYYSYYSPDIVPEFWPWLEFQARKGVCKIPPMVFAEIDPKGMSDLRDVIGKPSPKWV